MGYGYGQTEVTGFCLFGGYGGRGAGNAGRPAPVTSVRILDADGRECPIGEAGEICVRGATVHLGYWNRPEINAERFRGGWWHTTDLGRREPDGTITFLGTMTRMIKSGAENIFPAEVENCLEAHPAVKEAAVIGVPERAVRTRRQGRRRAQRDGQVTAADLIEHCRRHIASYKKPKTVEFLDALPRTRGFAKDYAALDEKFGGGGYPGGDNLGGGALKIAGKSVVVTGGASGIGRALAERFAAEGARGVTVADINGEWAQKTAERIGEQGIGVGCDVSDPDAINRLVSAAEKSFGPIDVFCSNAGFTDPAPGDLSQPVSAWRRIVEVNLMAHVWAAQAVVPSMLARGQGYLLQTISSAALITGPSGPGYTMTKHGALGFAEWLALNYGHRGIRVSCLCPNAVYTGMFGLPLDDESTVPPDGGALGEVLMPEDVAGTVIEAMAAERFLILPHSRVGDSFLRKATDYDAWLSRTRDRLRACLRVRRRLWMSIWLPSGSRSRTGFRARSHWCTAPPG